jgi:hypothetical protein
LTRSYLRCVEQWDEIYSAEASGSAPKTPDSGNAAFDRWSTLAGGEQPERDSTLAAVTVRYSSFCALLGTKKPYRHRSVQCGNRLRNQTAAGKCKQAHSTSSGRGRTAERTRNRYAGCGNPFEYLDNLYPEDAETLLRECARLLKPGGKALIKLNPYLTKQQIKDWEIKVIEGSLLDDGYCLE